VIVFASLRSRIILILIAAVMPAAILVCIFAYTSFEDARTTQFASLERDAEFLMSRLQGIPESAMRTAEMLGDLSDFATRVDADCSEDVRAMIDREPAYAAFAILRPGGPACAAAKAGSPPVAEIVAALPERGAGESGPRDALARLPGGRIMLVAQAPADRAGTPGATALVAVDDVYLASILAAFHSATSSVAALVDPQGAVVISPPGAILPTTWPSAPLTLTDTRAIHTATAGDGRRLVLTAARLGRLDLWLVTSQREDDVLGWPLRQLVVTALAPLVMILAALVAIWMGLHSTVLRWVSALSRATRAHAAGAITSRVGDASRAPREFAELASSFDALADRMADRTLELEREVAAKTSYIREIHHRVKNNLQVIGSLLALQKRELTPEQRAVLRFPEDRVNAMSAAYRASYAVSEIGQVPIGNVVREVAHRLQTSGDGKPVRFDLDFTGAELEVDLDTAVSIAMLMAEILPAYADASERTAVPVRIALVATTQRFSLLIDGPDGVERQTLHLGRRFIQAYLRQLNAQMEETRTATRIEAPFPRARVP
jgi:two-component sensor histidine kinase